VPGPWRTDLVPYLREPFADYTDTSVRSIVMMLATQCGKTDFMKVCLMYTIDRDPYPSLWVSDTQNNAIDFNQDRLIPAMKASPQLARHISARPFDSKRQKIEFDTMTLWFVGSGSAGNLASKPAGRIFLDERDKYPTSLRGKGADDAGAVQLAYKRLGAYGASGKAVEACSPTHENTGIHAEYLRSDQAKYYVPCPHCGHYQTLRLGFDTKGGLRWDGGMGLDLSDVRLAEHVTRVRASSYYECEDCGNRILNSQKPAMLRAGLWVRSGQIVEGRGERAQVVGNKPLTDVRGYQLSQLYSPFVLFGDVAAGLVKLRGEIDQDYQNGILGEPWTRPASRGDEGAIVEIAVQQKEQHEKSNDRKAEKYAKGSVPYDALVLLGTIDVQADGVFYEVSGFGEKEAKFLIDWGFVKCPEVPDGADVDDELFMSDHWPLVAELCNRVYPRTDTGEAVPVSWWGIDSGWRTDEVLRFAQILGPQMVPMKGSEQQAAPTAVHQSDKFSGIEVMTFRANHWRDQAYNRMHRRAPQFGAWRYPIDFAENGGHEYARQLTAEERQIVKQRGREMSVWVMRQGRKHNHYWDCAVMMQCLATHLGLKDLTRENAINDSQVVPASGPVVSGVRLA